MRWLALACALAALAGWRAARADQVQLMPEVLGHTMFSLYHTIWRFQEGYKSPVYIIKGLYASLNTLFYVRRGGFATAEAQFAVYQYKGHVVGSSHVHVHTSRATSYLTSHILASHEDSSMRILIYTNDDKEFIFRSTREGLYLFTPAFYENVTFDVSPAPKIFYNRVMDWYHCRVLRWSLTASDLSHQFIFKDTLFINASFIVDLRELKNDANKFECNGEDLNWFTFYNPNRESPFPLLGYDALKDLLSMSKADFAPCFGGPIFCFFQNYNNIAIGMSSRPVHNSYRSAIVSDEGHVVEEKTTFLSPTVLKDVKYEVMVEMSFPRRLYTTNLDKLPLAPGRLGKTSSWLPNDVFEEENTRLNVLPYITDDCEMAMLIKRVEDQHRTELEVQRQNNMTTTTTVQPMATAKKLAPLLDEAPEESPADPDWDPALFESQLIPSAASALLRPALALCLPVCAAHWPVGPLLRL